ncbi:MAG: trans-aconitate 2-methyltransferase [Rhodomicrobium sp.]|nr:trans-aconitate 2-methyltransferase [Rhodomicrobium sp.]
MAWSAQQYLKFEDERTRPARDLLQAVPTRDVKRAADLGCGPGNSTGPIAARFPDAAIVGVDNAPDMIVAAKARLPAVRFEMCGIGEWSEPGPWDLLFANASLQWVGDHGSLLPALAERLSPGGSLAIQMPDNLNEPSHVAMRAAALTEPFAAKLGGAAKARTELAGAGWYYALLKPLCSRVDIWRTTYFHSLAGGLDAIVEWLKGTGLIPFLKPLSEAEQQAFLAKYEDELAKAYEPLGDGTVILPFPRLFIVATR